LWVYYTIRGLKKTYSKIKIAVVDVGISNSVLASSIIEEATVQVTAQELGDTFDFNLTPTGEEDQFFNHEWE